MSSSRDIILGRVREALAPLPKRAPLPEWDLSRARSAVAPAGADLWPAFAARLRAVNGTPVASPDELVALLGAKGWHHGYCDPALWPALKAAFPATFTVETAFDRERVDDYQFGITSAVGAIAETGTIVLNDRGTTTRLAALAPWVHVAAIRRENIVPDLASALAVLGDDPNVIWVTGPSKTADVEGILIEGVHGPGLQVALLLD